MEIHVISGIDVGCKGPETQDSNGTWQQVYLNQGSLDGACGPYCLFMALIICGVLDRDKLLGDPLDRRTRHGRLFREFEKYSGFFHKGTDLESLAGTLRTAHGKRLMIESSCESGRRLRPFIEGHILAHHPVIVGLDSPRGAHWVLAVGLDYEADGELRRLHHFLVLDPGGDFPRVSAWNGIIDAYGSAGRCPYRYWGNYEGEDAWRVQLSEALALWPKE